jgi:hypothetical protein
VALHNHASFPPPVPPVNLNDNIIIGNWWGCPNGPGTGGCTTVKGTGVSFTPWLTHPIFEIGIRGPFDERGSILLTEYFQFREVIPRSSPLLRALTTQLGCPLDADPLESLLIRLFDGIQ